MYVNRPVVVYWFAGYSLWTGLEFFTLYGQALSSASPREQWRTGKNGENWLQSHLGCPYDPRGSGIDESKAEYRCQRKSKPLFAKLGENQNTAFGLADFDCW